jgi:hypothetical protein
MPAQFVFKAECNDTVSTVRIVFKINENDGVRPVQLGA